MDLQIFNNEEFGKIRTVEKNDVVYFAGSDVAKALGYAIPHKAVQTHCKGVLKWNIPTDSGNQDVLFITEGDVYRLIMRSKLPSAKRFESWVMDEVLPSIRKNGGYIAGQETMTDDELLAKALMVANNKIAERDRIIEHQKAKIEYDRPKTIFADAVATSNTSILVGDLAKIICQNGVQIGAKRLFSWLRDNGYLIKRKGADWNMPTQKSIEMGLFEIKESTHINGSGCNVTTKTPKATGKAQIYFVNKFLSGMNNERFD